VFGALAAVGSAILLWFFSGLLTPILHRGQLSAIDTDHWAMLAFLFLPAMVLAVVALFWVPPRPKGQGPIPEGRRWRIVLLCFFGAALLVGFVAHW
jgi:uncharacterized BrkB/YihY/UPF0761 family membrane protein